MVFDRWSVARWAPVIATTPVDFHREDAGQRPDLVCALDRAGARPGIEFMRLSSYGLATESSGVVQLIGDIPASLAGRPVLLVDDIVDTGRTIAYAAAQLRQCGIGDLWTCALLDKRSGGRSR
jgi:hypoxanthine phosphoribosyltransferase